MILRGLYVSENPPAVGNALSHMIAKATILMSMQVGRIRKGRPLQMARMRYLTVRIARLASPTCSFFADVSSVVPGTSWRRQASSPLVKHVAREYPFVW